MKNIENMTKLNDMAMAAVAGGDDDRTVVDAFVDWLLSPIEDALNNIVVSNGDRPLPGLPGQFPSPYDPTNPEF